MRDGALCRARCCHQAAEFGYCSSAAAHAHWRAVPCSLLPPGDQIWVLQVRSRACAVACRTVLAAATRRPKLGTAGQQPRMRCGAPCRARCCHQATKFRYCRSAAAHAQWRAVPCSLLPPGDQNWVLQLRSRACAVARRAVLKFWARFFTKAVMPAIPPCDRFSLKISGPFPQATETGCERGTAFRICFLQCLSPQDQYLGQACSMVHCRVSSIPSRASSSGPSQTSRYPRITRSSLFRCRTIRMPSLPMQRNTH